MGVMLRASKKSAHKWLQEKCQKLALEKLSIAILGYLYERYERKFLIDIFVTLVWKIPVRYIAEFIKITTRTLFKKNPDIKHYW